jgi:hypothetical protein
MDINIQQHDVLRWLHVLAMVYWLGGEWGVFTASRYVDKPELSIAERLRHMDTAYRIDILARTGIVLLLPLGLHMGWDFRIHMYGEHWLSLMWALTAGWLGLVWAAFRFRGTDLGLKLTRIDDYIRWVLIPALLIAGLWSLFGEGPFRIDWYSAKVTIYAGLLIIGLYLRYIMHEWVGDFRKLAASGGSDAAVEAKIHRILQHGRNIAYFYWIGIATVAFLGITKPF